MRSFKIVALLGIAFGQLAPMIAHSENVYTVKSLQTICLAGSREADLACAAYLHGIVEGWMLQDVAGVSPDRYQSRDSYHYENKKGPAYCGFIGVAGEDEWKRVVVRNLANANDGPAAQYVMYALHDMFCK
jgi:hypothetical protein